MLLDTSSDRCCKRFAVSLQRSSAELEVSPWHVCKFHGSTISLHLCADSSFLLRRRTSLSKYREAGLADDHYLVTCTLGNLEVAENVIAGN
jgi:hypothetical protein